ncbi:TylF/MycF family methyltransferase [Sphingobium soli]|uniref:TylF/MycF family methyltransferase n=1 Tax=Sphingobium soli TaxID=1591116 RepID=A0ABS8H3E4_9SPHN|nr:MULTISPECIES: TylF/MycF/NovP-related O-methyltransferase [Sphingobium]MCC4233069.1 TylF/MycF family methyltransferase [Sphingobium soli]
MKIIVFGSGSAAKDFLSMVPAKTTVLGLSDNDSSKHGTTVDGFEILDPASLTGMNFDYVVITARAVDQIRAGLIEMGVAADKIVTYYASYSRQLHEQANRDIRILNEAIGLGLRPAGLATMYLDKAQPLEQADAGPGDYVRNGAFHLAARQIRDRGVPGAVAELGVYKGDQACLINRLFADRTLYLFDTFSGFSDRDLDAESEGNFSSAIVGDFVDTSIELVESKLPHPDRAKFFPGFFPETAEGLEETFAFVSLDVDLYDPTRAGLHWFYDRLSPGGYIFVHDYNNCRYMGVSKAVDAFVAATGACLVPLPDFAGSVVIAK